MSNKISNVTCAFILSVTGCIPTYADNYDLSCAVQVAVSTPPITAEQNVAFNVAGDNGIIKSITLKGLSAPQTIQNIPCSDSFNLSYHISATLYSTTTNLTIKVTPWIGECRLTAGPIVLNGSSSIISVVFPNDFVCHEPLQAES